MPPRKRAKASAASTPLADAQPKTPQETPAAPPASDHASPQNDVQMNDAWSDEQETQLFKSVIKWKPTGLHKHFRIISIYNNMRSHGYVDDQATHTRIPGLWRKLESLYDLHALDERENAYAFHDRPEPSDPDEAYSIPDFELPEEEYGELMWQRRFHGPDSEASSSPPAIPADEDKALFRPGIGLLRDLPGGPRSHKAESVSGATPTPRPIKNTRASRAATKSGKGAKATANAKNTKARSAVSESAEEEDEEEEAGSEEEEESAESEADTAPSTRRTNRSAKQTKPPPKRTRKR